MHVEDHLPKSKTLMLEPSIRGEAIERCWCLYFSIYQKMPCREFSMKATIENGFRYSLKKCLKKYFHHYLNPCAPIFGPQKRSNKEP